MKTRRFTKPLDGVLDYGVEWGTWLGDDTIATSTWDVPDGITMDSSEIDGTFARIWLSGGTQRGLYHKLTNHMVTAAGRHNDETITIKII